MKKNRTLPDTDRESWNIASWFFFLVTVSVLVSALYTFIAFFNASLPLQFALPPIFPSWGEVTRNIRAALNGYPNSYLLFLKGSFYFILMAFSFIGSGLMAIHILFDRFKTEIRMEKIELISIAYLIGAFIFSLLLLGLGAVHLLYFSSALVLLIIGCICFLCVVTRIPLPLPALSGPPPSGKLGKILTAALSIFTVVILCLLASICMTPQTYSDTLITHLVLPNAYIQFNSIAPFPYHIQSYFPQSMEMLVMWALLLKSESCAVLLMWGFLVSFLLFIYSRVSEQTDRLTGLVSVLFLLSMPVLLTFGITIKNDFPVAVYIITGILLLMRFFATSETEPQFNPVWLFLSAVFLGAAIGIKYTALPLIVSAVFFIPVLLYFRKQSLNMIFRSCGLWSIVVLTAASTWLIRSVISTGNPIYPYVFHGTLVKPWHKPVVQATSIAVSGIHGLFDFLKNLVVFRQDAFPDIGAIAIFLLLMPMALRSRRSFQYTTGLLIVLGGTVILLLQSLESRYFISVFIFLTVITFTYGSDMPKSERTKKAAHLILTVSSILLVLNSLKFTNMQTVIRISMTRLFSGYSIGNGDEADQGMNNLRWMCHLIESRTPQDELVLYVGINYAYGLDRKSFFNSDLDRDLITDWAAEAANTDDLAGRLKKMGVRHILVDNNLIATGGKRVTEDISMPPIALQMTKDLLQSKMTRVINSPENQFSWYTFPENYRPLVLNEKDAHLFPTSLSNQAMTYIEEGRIPEAIDIFKMVVEAPVHRMNKMHALSCLALLYQQVGKDDLALQSLELARRENPDRPEVYLNSAEYFLNKRDIQTATMYLKTAAEHGAGAVIEADNRLKQLLKGN